MITAGAPPRNGFANPSHDLSDPSVRGGCPHPPRINRKKLT